MEKDTYTSKDLQSEFEILQKKHGSHIAAAQIFPIDEDHYCALRNGRSPIPLQTANHIRLEAGTAQATPPRPKQPAPRKNAKRGQSPRPPVRPPADTCETCSPQQ